MKSIAEMCMEELAAYVCSKLDEKGIDTVLSGGSCVQIYSHGKYTSDDIDLIDRFNGGHSLIKKMMFDMGFREHNRYFVHEDTSLFIEFPRGPLGVGDAPVNNIATLEEETGILKLLTPTDCIKDRLAAYYHWDDPQGLEQAVWVAEQNDFDLKLIEAWSKNENELGKFKIFRSRV
ncbi:hypothetical protein [Sulfurovum sp. NBC37-1]|uniref:hypothetical protein n=1 Tax=Sulfurovum sp. (strain NBC37-1) TaxID=387093 RepID=UPI0001587814|nr:hypothetical protein [Sulfurovum sp. NBC37-1]BAF71668.1 conserved hypothetical protein [Sulfurovum sp. NBC37-1]